MNYQEFQCIVEEKKKQKPILFELEHDKILTKQEIKEFQKKNNIILPEKYCDFLAEYGGGYFGYANIYSLDSNSNFYLLLHRQFSKPEYLPIADNGCGDYYVVKVENNTCFDKIYFYDKETEEIQDTSYEDILEYLLGAGLKISNLK